MKQSIVALSFFMTGTMMISTNFLNGMQENKQKEINRLQTYSLLVFTSKPLNTIESLIQNKRFEPTDKIHKQHYNKIVEDLKNDNAKRAADLEEKLKKNYPAAIITNGLLE